MNIYDRHYQKLVFWSAMLSITKLVTGMGCIALLIALAMSEPELTPNIKQFTLGVMCLASAGCFFFAREEARRYRRLLCARVRVENRR